MIPPGFTTQRVGAYDVLTPTPTRSPFPNMQVNPQAVRPAPPPSGFRVLQPPLRLVPPMPNFQPLPAQSGPAAPSGFPAGGVGLPPPGLSDSGGSFPAGGVGLPPPDGSDGSGPTPFRLEPLPPSAGGAIVPAGPGGQLTLAQRLQSIPWWGWGLLITGGYLLYKYHKRGKDPRFWGAPA